MAGSLRVGTSSWSSADWRGPFYPDDAASGDLLALCCQHFDTVECDATFYRIPTAKTVEGWRAKTPESFLFCAKLPQEITHEKGLVDCGPVLAQFLGVMKRLGDRLAPIVAQCPYVAKGKDAEEYATGDDFRARLASFLDSWPAEVPLAVEVRNATWIAPPLLELLRERHVALALSAYYTMPPPDRLFQGPDPQTTDLLYVRFLGDHKRMDERVAQLRATKGRTADWNALAVDKEPEMRRWVQHLKPRVGAGSKALAYFNNHYAGFPPASARAFFRMWEDGQGGSLASSRRDSRQIESCLQSLTVRSPRLPRRKLTVRASIRLLHSAASAGDSWPASSGEREEPERGGEVARLQQCEGRVHEGRVHGENVRGQVIRVESRVNRRLQQGNPTTKGRIL